MARRRRILYLRRISIWGARPSTRGGSLCGRGRRVLADPAMQQLSLAVAEGDLWLLPLRELLRGGFPWWLDVQARSLTKGNSLDPPSLWVCDARWIRISASMRGCWHGIRATGFDAQQCSPQSLRSRCWLVHRCLRCRARAEVLLLGSFPW